MARASGLEGRIAVLLNARTERAALAPAARLVILVGMLSVTVLTALARVTITFVAP
jgi:hypothetical protein